MRKPRAGEVFSFPGTGGSVRVGPSARQRRRRTDTVRCMRTVRGILATAAVMTVGALAALPSGAGAAAGCGPSGGTVRTVDGVRFFTVKTTVKGKARVSLQVCSSRKPSPKLLAAGPPSLVGFGPFHTSGPFAGFEVVGVQSDRGQAGRGTNLNVGWVDTRTGTMRTNFLFIDVIRPNHVYAVDAQTGSLALLASVPDVGQELWSGPFNRTTNRFTGTDYTFNAAGWNQLELGDAQDKVVPGSLRVSGGKVRFRTTGGDAVALDD